MPASGRKTPADLRVLAAGYLLGILAVYALPRVLPWWTFLAAPLIALPLLYLPATWRHLFVALWLGAIAATMQADRRLAAQLPHSEEHQDIWLTGEIAELPERKGADWRFVFASADSPLRRLRVSWYRSDALLKAGQCWRLQLRLRSPHGLMNPGGFDYEAWLFREGIGATGYVRQAQTCAVTEARVLNFGQRRILELRQHIVDQVAARLPEHPMRGVVLGLTVGDDSAIDDTQWRILRRTGTTHLISISGLHITLAAGFVFFLMRWNWSLWPALCLRWPAQRIGALTAMLAAVFYSVLAGFSIPTQRSLLMLLVLMGALAASRQTAPSRLLTIALLAVLVLDPSAVLHPGFWLSFGAVAWMLYGLTARLRPPGRIQVWLQPQWLLALALVPPCLFWFGESSLIAPLANALMIPLFSLLIPWLLVAISLLGSAAGDWMLLTGADALNGLWQVFLWAAALPQAYWTWAPPGVAALVVAMIGLLLALAPRGVPARSLGCVLCVPLLFTTPALPSGSVELTVLDVGQGHAAVLRTRRHSLLFDAGPAPAGGLNTGEAVVLPYLRKIGVRQLDRLVLSHDHLDHSGGIEALRAGIPIVEETGTARGAACRAGDHWDWDGVRFEFLHPDAGAWSVNNESCVLRISTGEHAMLLTGDIEAEAESALLQDAAKLAVQVIVVPHHGSRTSSTPEFVAAVKPRYALVPAGWSNRWRFPKTQVVERWQAAGAQVEISGRSGALILRMSEQAGVEELIRWREQSRFFWRAG